jgi:hypothetical protein
MAAEVITVGLEVWRSGNGHAYVAEHGLLDDVCLVGADEESDVKLVVQRELMADRLVALAESRGGKRELVAAAREWMSVG